MADGWIKLHRSTLENPIVCKDSDHLAVWVYLLMKVTHKEYDTIFEGKRYTLKPGQQIFGRKSIASDLKVNESKVQRILKTFESEQQIEQQTSSKNRLVSIVNWSRYQDSEQLIEQQLNNKRTTTEQQVNTNNNTNNTNNSKKRVTRHKHGEYSHILLTDEQYERLKTEYPAIDETIKKMDEWIQLKGKPYNDYNLALRKWLKDEPKTKPTDILNFQED